MTRITACLLGIFCFAGAAAAVPAEYEINLVRNAAFQSGLDRQGPQDWTYYNLLHTNILDAGRGYVEFFEGGMTASGPANFFQFDMWDDVAPAYKISCSMKSEGAKGQVQLRPRPGDSMGGCMNYTLSNKQMDEWENMEMTVSPTNHYGFCMTIRAPAGGKISVSNLRVTAVFPPPETVGTVRLENTEARGICLPGNPNGIEQLTAHELQVNLYRVSGVRLPVYACGDELDGAGYIRIKNLQKMIPDKPVRAAPASAPEANGFRIVCAGGNLDLIGGNDAGVLAGAMHLSELCGAKFYAPKIFSIKTEKELKIPAMDIARQPAFEWTTGPGSQHQTLSAWKYGYLHPDSTVAPSDMASPPMPGWIHPSWFLAPPYLYAANHPEYYALVKGRRVVDGPNRQLEQSWGYLNLCLGNPELHQVIEERIGRLMDIYPHTKYFSIAQGDGRGWCECDLCTALDADKTIFTDRLIAYANAVAGLLETKYPDRKLLFHIYGAGREELPLREKMHPNVRGMYSFWPSSWPVWEATDCPQNQRGLQLLDGWNALTGTNLLLGLYPINPYENADKIKLAAAKGIRGFNQCGVRGDFPEIMIYTTGRLIWEPDADVEPMIDEIMPLIYGAAAPQMRAYFDLHHAFVRDCVDHPEKRRLYRDNNTHRYRRLPMAHSVKALELLAGAEAAAADRELALVKIQTEKYKVLFGYINEFNARHPAIPEDLFEDYARKLAELVKLARKCHEPFAGYRVPFSEWLYQTTGVLDFDREPYKWFSDKNIDEFLADPVKTLKTRGYLQSATTNGLDLPAKAWIGTRYHEKYQGHAGAVLRRKSSAESRVRAYFQLEFLPGGDAQLELQGLDNEKADIAEIEIIINGINIFAGAVKYPKNKWGWQNYEIPDGCLKTGENIIVIVNTLGDYKEESAGGQAGPAAEAMAAQYNWGWCMVGQARLIWNEE